MDREEEAEHAAARPEKGRVSGRRFAGPIKYTRFEGRDAGGRLRVFVRVETPSDPDVATQVFDTIRDLKRLHDKARGISFPTGLAFSRDRRHGRVWTLPATPDGRYAADIIEIRLQELARRLEEGQDTQRSR